MGARQVAYYDYDAQAELDCPACGWHGTTGPDEYFDELFDVRCPSCERMLLIVSFPTAAETRAAAAAGNEEAIAALPAVAKRERFLADAAASELQSVDQLPELGGDELVITWDFVQDDAGAHWTVLRHGDTVLWRERAYWEGFERFRDVAVLLQERYGARLRGLTPTRAASMWLLGDRLWTIAAVDRINARLAAGQPPVGDDKRTIWTWPRNSPRTRC